MYLEKKAYLAVVSIQVNESDFLIYVERTLKGEMVLVTGYDGSCHFLTCLF